MANSMASTDRNSKRHNVAGALGFAYPHRHSELACDTKLDNFRPWHPIINSNRVRRRGAFRFATHSNIHLSSDGNFDFDQHRFINPDHDSDDDAFRFAYSDRNPKLACDTYI